MTSETPAEQRDHWIAKHNEAQQQIQELRLFVANLLSGPLAPEELDQLRVLMERTRP